MSRDIYITETDLSRLEALISTSRQSPTRELLEEELLRATIVPAEAVPPNVVTMNSRVRFIDTETGEETEATLVYPKDADIDQGKVSVFAPVGAALLGLSVGDTIEWPVPSGRTRSLRIAAVLFQPEAEKKSRS